MKSRRTSAPEPVLWPVRGYGEPLELEAADLPGMTMPLVFGELADSGLLACDLGGEDPDEPVVFWIDREVHLVEPRRIAGSVTAFVEAWCDAQLILPSVLEVAGVPGWQWSRK